MALLGVPTNLTVAVLSSSEVQLDWNIGFEDDPVLEVSPPKVQILDNFSVAPIAEVASTVQTHRVAGLQAGLHTFSICFLYQTNGRRCNSSLPVQIGTNVPPVITPQPKPPAPHISSIEPHQATLHNEGKIVVRWTATTNFDQYHFMAREKPHDFSAVEIDSSGTSGFFTVTPTFPGREYSFKVQGCVTHLIGLNNCSEFTLLSNTMMPQNTHSLREFLQLSNVQLNPGMRSLGAPALSAGIRAMMRL